MIDAFTILLLALSFLYVAFVVAEHFYAKNKRKKLRYVVHVNGIRGKSTVTRLIDAGMRGCGFKTFSKTTGTVPMTIGVDGVHKKINRLGPANVREQLSAVKWAANEGAEALVVECMAVNPELQYVCERRILHSDVVVVTNVRYDHLDQMGETLEEIAASLANTTPKNGVLVLGEGVDYPVFDECAKKMNATVRKAKRYEGDDLGTFAENVAVALEVARALNLDEDAFFEGMKSYVRDPGALSIFTLGETKFVNGFSINDPDSILAVYSQICQTCDPKDVTVLLNTRPDRPFRINQHVEMLTKMVFRDVLIVGSNLDYVKRELRKRGIEAEVLKDFEVIKSKKVVFGCGNIAAAGMKILEYCKQNGVENG